MFGSGPIWILFFRSSVRAACRWAGAQHGTALSAGSSHNGSGSKTQKPTREPRAAPFVWQHVSEHCRALNTPYKQGAWVRAKRCIELN
jgi:hypothetical protein